MEKSTDQGNIVELPCLGEAFLEICGHRLEVRLAQITGVGKRKKERGVISQTGGTQDWHGQKRQETGEMAAVGEHCGHGVRPVVLILHPSLN